MSVPAIVVLAASLAARDHGGILAYRVHRVSEISAGPFHRHDDVILAVVFDNDRLADVRVLRDEVNGKPAGVTAEQSLAHQLQSDSKRPAFAAPFDARHFAEYRYSVAGNHVRFSTDAEDAQHANGSFDVGAGGAVTQLEYVPNRLPRFATAGIVREQRAEVLPQFWATVRSDESYDGRYAIFRGHAELVTVNADFHRFSDIAAATAWLQAERL